MTVRRFEVLESFDKFNQVIHEASYKNSLLKVQVREKLDELSRRRSGRITEKSVTMQILSIGREDTEGKITVQAFLRPNNLFIHIIASEEEITFEEIT